MSFIDSNSIGIGITSPNYNLDVSGNANVSGFLLQKSIYFISFISTGTYNITTNQPLSAFNLIVAQNLGGFSSSLYGFQTANNGVYPAGTFIAPITGLYSFYLNYQETANTNLSDYYPAIISSNGTINSNIGVYIFKPQDPDTRRMAVSSLLVQLTQGQGFYWASDHVGSTEVSCYFSGKFEGFY